MWGSFCAYGRPALDWRLITNLKIDTAEEAVEKLGWYAMRWKIEVFHKILKSGCRAEEAKLRTAERLVNLIAIFCLLSWRIFWMTMINRTAPNAPPTLVLTDEECTISSISSDTRHLAQRATIIPAKGHRTRRPSGPALMSVFNL